VGGCVEEGRQYENKLFNGHLLAPIPTPGERRELAKFVRFACSFSAGLPCTGAEHRAQT
jgi:hypothetical protein